jgi:hypothetical protein
LVLIVLVCACANVAQKPVGEGGHGIVINSARRGNGVVDSRDECEDGNSHQCSAICGITRG